MKKTQNVKDIIEAIESVKQRARIAWLNKDMILVTQLGADLSALECCLFYQVRELLAAEEAA